MCILVHFTPASYRLAQIVHAMLTEGGLQPYQLESEVLNGASADILFVISRGSFIADEGCERERFFCEVADPGQDRDQDIKIREFQVPVGLRQAKRLIVLRPECESLSGSELDQFRDRLLDACNKIERKPGSRLSHLDDSLVDDAANAKDIDRLVLAEAQKA